MSTWQTPVASLGNLAKAIAFCKVGEKLPLVVTPSPSSVIILWPRSQYATVF